MIKMIKIHKGNKKYMNGPLWCYARKLGYKRSEIWFKLSKQRAQNNFNSCQS